MKFGVITTADCLNSAPGADPRCSDEAFAAANPDICPIQPQIVLKPGLALVCLLGSIQFKAFVIKNGVELDITDDAVFTSSNLSVAVVGASSGNATGLSGGTTTITATYQGLSASSEITVFPDTDCCDEQTVAMMVLIDTSKSMSLGFNAQYVSRLAFAKAAATRFISEINENKDLIGLMSFNALADTILSNPVADKAAVGALVAGIVQTQQSTAFYDALSDAIASLDNAGADRKVIVLMSDGEDQTDTYNDTNNPIKLLNEFKLQGGIVICLGVRASGEGYALMNTLATGGFFINSYDTTADAALDYISGLKGYVCAGNCTPIGDIITPTGQLDYDGFINWDVDGHVDLIGAGLMDLLPGNGLYVDLAGSTAPLKGTLTSKVTYAIESGKEYRVSMNLAGNQRVDDTPNTVSVRIFTTANVELLSHTVSIDDFAQDFSQYAFTFESPADTNVYIEIQQIDTPTSGDTAGLLLDRVKFENLTDVITLLDDNFDDENETYVPPACGVGTIFGFVPGDGYGYHVGYDCDAVGCLTEPPAAQLQDPDPLDDIEAGFKPPKVYSATQMACASCPSGFINQSDENLVPVMTSNTEPSGEASAVVEDAPAFEAFDQDDGTSWQANVAYPTTVGFTDLPAWLQYQFDAAVTAKRYDLKIAATTGAPKQWILQGSSNGSTWTDIDSRVGITWFANETKKFEIEIPGSYAYYRLLVSDVGAVGPNVGSGTATLTIVAFGLFEDADAQVCADASDTSEISQQDANTKAYSTALADAQSQLNCQKLYTSTQQYTTTCPVGCFGAPVTKSSTATSFVSQAEADAEALAEAKSQAEAALDCSGSNNTQRIDAPSDLPETAPSPYPSVKYVSGMVGAITKVTVTIKQVDIGIEPEDARIMLRGPSGTMVELQRNAGGGPKNFGGYYDITFDDDAAAAIPDSTIDHPSAGAYSFKPSLYGAQVSYPAPAPAAPYGIVLADFIGEDPNGCWSLWVYTVNHGVVYTSPNNNQGYSTLRIFQGFDLSIFVA